jgi:hypothetical protein
MGHWESGAAAPRSKAAWRPRVFRAKRRGARKFRFDCGTGSFAQLEENCLTPGLFFLVFWGLALGGMRL